VTVLITRLISKSGEMLPALVMLIVGSSSNGIRNPPALSVSNLGALLRRQPGGVRPGVRHEAMTLFTISSASVCSLPFMTVG
jgi:hypothetical protein